MSDKLIDIIKQRSRHEWEQLIQDRWTALRIWIQENGELAAVVSLIVGIIFVLAFKFVVVCVVLCGLAGYGIWYLAPENASSDPKIDDRPEDRTPSNTHSENSRPTEH